MAVVSFFLRSYIVFFFKQKTAYEMRISDWSSDVCSSDLLRLQRAGLVFGLAALRDFLLQPGVRQRQRVGAGLQADEENGQVDQQQIGRASCRERVCQYV